MKEELEEWAGSILTVLIALAIGVMFILTIAFQADTIPDRPAQKIAAEDPFDYARQLQSFYKRCAGCVDQDIVDLAANYTQEAAGILCMEDETDTLLAMWHRESGFDPAATDGHCCGNSLGVAQTRKIYIEGLREKWKYYHIDLGEFKDIKTQIYMGTMEFRDHLAESDGDIREAVRRYNGSGKRAERYANRVMASRLRIFGRAYVTGETTSLYKECMP